MLNLKNCKKMEKLKYETYCTNTLEDDKLWKENIEKWSGDENKQYKIHLC